jgi:hypothetical protein
MDYCGVGIYQLCVLSGMCVEGVSVLKRHAWFAEVYLYYYILLLCYVYSDSGWRVCHCCRDSVATGQVDWAAVGATDENGALIGVRLRGCYFHAARSSNTKISFLSKKTHVSCCLLTIIHGRVAVLLGCRCWAV